MDDELNDRLDQIEHKLDQIIAQIGPWPQTGNRTLLDLTAALAATFAVPGTRDVLGG